MHFLVTCTDIEDRDQASGLRRQHLAAHLRHVEEIMGDIAVAGPLVDHGSESYTSSCFIFQAANRDSAMTILKGDPYFQAGLYAHCDCREFKPVAGLWVGGKNW